MNAKRAKGADLRNIVTEMMYEVAMYGGIPLRRMHISTLAKEHMPGVKEPFGPQYFAFHPPAVNLEPWSLEDARRVMSGGAK